MSKNSSTSRILANRNISIALVVVIAILSVYGLKTYLNSKTVKDLESVEVREYQGEKLGSIADFRENSIKGPQEVDVNSYILQVMGLVQSPRNYSYEEVLEGYQRHSRGSRYSPEC
jgi:hypothetical protein